MALTTAAKVRARLGIDTFQASDASIADPITDAEGLISYSMGSLPVVGDSGYALAASTVTSLAAYYTGMNLPYPEDPAESEAWINKVSSLMVLVKSNTEVLRTLDYPVAVAKSTTEE